MVGLTSKIPALLIISSLLLLPSTPLALSDVATDFLKSHNKFRAKKGSPPLVWDDKLAQAGHDYGVTRIPTCDITHSDLPYGENVFTGPGKDWRPRDAVKIWKDEGKYYNLASNTCAKGKKCDHYTQVVWKSTKRVGCAVLPCNGDKDTYIICEYDPPGNVAGERPFDHS